MRTKVALAPNGDARHSALQIAPHKLLCVHISWNVLLDIYVGEKTFIVI